LVVLSSRKKLAQLGDIKQIETVVGNYFERFDGTSYLIYHDSPPFPLDPVSDDPESIRSLLNSFEDKFLPIDYLTILGGDEIIPFFRLPNPCEDDDEYVLSDNPYASRDDEYLIPERAVGRIPSAGNIDFMLGQFDKEYSGDDAFGLSAKVWQEASREVYRIIDDPKDLEIAPPITLDQFDPDWLKGKRYLYFNLHGSDISPYWYGQDGSNFPRALGPSLTTMASGVVGSEACYGAYIVEKKIEESLALSFLKSDRCLGMVGSTTIAYGPFVPPSSEADRLIKYFFQYLEMGLDLGMALKSAKVDFARRKMRWKGFLDEDDQKTLIQFILLGDPLRRVRDERGMD
ncbi:hypothetical protein DRP53_09995, partial [candidate division WOR-3 bacterium]